MNLTSLRGQRSHDRFLEGCLPLSPVDCSLIAVSLLLIMLKYPASSFRQRIRSMFYHAYNSYLDNAFPYDELRPLTCDGQDTWGRWAVVWDGDAVHVEWTNPRYITYIQGPFIVSSLSNWIFLHFNRLWRFRLSSTVSRWLWSTRSTRCW